MHIIIIIFIYCNWVVTRYFFERVQHSLPYVIIGLIRVLYNVNDVSNSVSFAVSLFNRVVLLAIIIRCFISVAV